MGSRGISTRAMCCAMLGALVLATVGVAASCVDGVTPNCSDPAVQCGPIDSSADQQETTRDGAPDVSPDTFVPDAAPDGDLDAGDEE